MLPLGVPVQLVGLVAVPRVRVVGVGAVTVRVNGIVALTQPVVLVVLLRTVKLKLYVPAALAGIGTLMELPSGKSPLVTALKLGMAVGVPVVILY